MFTFIHTSDLHLGAPFGFLSPEAAQKLRLAQLEALRQIKELARENNANFVFLCGDVFNSQNPGLKEVAEFRSWTEDVSKLSAKIFIIPGNHDAYAENGFWDRENFSATVFRGRDFQRIEMPDFDLTIFGFPCRRENSSKRILADLGDSLSSSSKHKIVLFHGAWENFGKELEKDYPFSTAELSKIEADYIALGNYHGHLKVSEKPLASFSGSPVPLDFSDSDREPSVILGKVDQICQISQIPLAGPILKSEILDLTTISASEFLQKIHQGANENLFWQIKLQGLARLEILKAIEEARELAAKFSFLEIDDSNLLTPKDVPKDETYLGRFCSELIDLQEQTQNEQEKRIISKAIQLGLAYFDD